MSTTIEKQFEIRVIYNGVTEKLEVNAHQQVTAVREHAVHLFHITQNAHLLSLFREDGSEIADNQSVEAAGIRPNELLALRPSAVRGG